MRFKSIYLILLVFVLLFSSCSVSNISKATLNDKINIVTTLYPLYEFANVVGGDNVDVTLLLPPGAEPHDFEPTPSDIRKIHDADIFIYVGDMMEPWARDILDGINNPNLVTIDSSSVVNLIESDHDHGHDSEDVRSDEIHLEDDHDDDHINYDPHLWLNLQNDVLIVKKIASVLSDMDVNNSDYYNNLAESYIPKLVNLDNEYSKLSLTGNDGFGCKKSEVIIGGHNFFAYITDKYHISAISAIDNLEPNAEPTPKRIKMILDVVKDHNVSYILTEELLSPRLAEVISSETGASVLNFSPGASLSKDDFKNKVTFISILENNLKTLKIALECNVE